MTPDPWDWVSQWPVTRVFGEITPGLERFGPHTGVDLALPSGTPVIALANGPVIVDDDDPAYDPAQPRTWSGIQVSYRSNLDGTTITCAHLDSNSVESGQVLSIGQIIGFCGATGAATGPHLHLETREVTGELIDPLIYFKEAPMLTEDQIREIAKEEARAILSQEAWLSDAVKQAVALAIAAAPEATITEIRNRLSR